MMAQTGNIYEGNTTQSGVFIQYSTRQPCRNGATCHKNGCISIAPNKRKQIQRNVLQFHLYDVQKADETVVSKDSSLRRQKSKEKEENGYRRSLIVISRGGLEWIVTERENDRGS